METLTGVRATFGGAHPGRGTHNALLALGPNAYLEIIAPDPAQPQPAEPRWFGIDAIQESRLVTWAANSTDVDRLHADASHAAVPLGRVRAGSRQRADGATLSWRFTSPEMVADGIVPFFIDWGDSPHPATTAPKGATLVAMRAEHPDPDAVTRMLAALGLSLPVTRASTPALIAVVEGTRGRIELR